MKKSRIAPGTASLPSAALPARAPSHLAGAAAFGDWHSDAPGVRRRITPADLPLPLATPAIINIPRVVGRPATAKPNAPPGFEVALFAEGFDNPRTVRVAPNGDIFVAESKPGRIRVLRPAEGGEKPARTAVFAAGLNLPFGIAFYPPGPDPQYLYIGNTDSIVRFPYRRGDLEARAAPELVLGQIPIQGHWTREIIFAPDGKQLFISVGSLSNAAEDMPRKSLAEAQEFEKRRRIGSAWGFEQFRANILTADPLGNDVRIFATGLRNAVGMAFPRQSRTLWCSVNERDQAGDNLVPDFVTRVQGGEFFGWPWYYIGAFEDPHHKGERPDLAEVVAVPDVLIQPHSAPLAIAFYEADQFPPDYRGDLFVALHGSYNRSQRTGYKVVRLILRNGVPTGEYEDFMTGFVVSDAAVWGRPVGVAIDKHGALLVSEDGNGTIWRATRRAAL